jgi:hypothetical protein
MVDTGAVAYATIMETPYATLIAKAGTIYLLICGLMMYFGPVFFATIYGLPAVDEKEVYTSRKIFGLNLTFMSVFLTALLWDTPYLVSFGMAWGAYGILLFLLLGELKEMKMHVPTLYFYVGLSSFAAMALMHQLVEEETPLEDVKNEING